MKKPLPEMPKPAAMPSPGALPSIGASMPHLSEAPDPLANLPQTEDPEQSAVEELDAVQQGFRDRAKQEAERLKGATDAGYYAVLCFHTGDQVQAFLEAIEYSDPGARFIDGLEVAKRLKIAVPEAKLRFNTSDKADKKLAALPQIGG